MDNSQEYFDKLKEQFQEKVQEAYMEGAHQGAITTAALIYNIMLGVGLEESNILFTILKDIAKKHGCDDITPVVEKLRHKETSTDDKMPS